ncbi:DUF1566 domain-containing protein [Cellvibrio sp. KY-GH-1]|nr:DUF1566 domain-containing protein [Cellvibrio sp. KY-GH-1]
MQSHEVSLAIESIPGCAEQTVASQKANALTQAINDAIFTIPAIGQPWPKQGGVNAGLIRGENGKPDYYLIIATDDAGKTDRIEYGGYESETEGANSEFDGLANTTALLKSGTDHPAASWAAGVIIEGHNDFYLPARREQSLMYANCPELFNDVWHWSSTQYSAGNAWVQDFEDGYQDVDSKDCRYAARAVRRYYPLTNSTI